MRVAIFSDVHGNLTAFEAVLEDIAQQEVDHTIFAGDLCLVGPRPAACVRRARVAELRGLYGNTDEWVLGRQEPPPHLAELADWTLAQLDESERTWLDDLPFSQRISASDDPSQDLLVVHANPVDVNRLIFPPEAEQRCIWGRLRQSDNKLKPLLTDLDVGLLAFGHLHIPNERQVAGMRLVNISSVSLPGDDDPRAKYGILTWVDGRWEFERRRVSYDVAAEIAAYRTAQPPGWETSVQTLEAQGFLAQKV